MKQAVILAALLLSLLAFTSLALAQGGYGLSWWTVDGGGGAASGGPYTLVGTIGQPDAGPVLSNGDYSLASGFWYGVGPAAEPEMHLQYLPLVVRNDQ